MISNFSAPLYFTPFSSPFNEMIGGFGYGPLIHNPLHLANSFTSPICPWGGKKLEDTTPSFISNIYEVAKEVLLFDRTVDVEKINEFDEDGETLVHTAVKMKDITVLKILKESGADFNLRNFKGETALHLAVKNNQEEEVKELIALGADLDIVNFEGDTPLYTASHLLQPTMIKILVDNGANTKFVNKIGYTPLIICKFRHPIKNCEKMLGKHSYADKVLSLKFLSHAWELGGTTKIESHSLTMGLGWSPYFANKMAETLKDFGERHASIQKKEIRRLVSLLERSRDNGMPQDAEKILDDFNNGKPILIYSGFNGHAVAVSLSGNYLIIGNKGMESRKPIEIFKINRNKVTKHAIQQMIDLIMQSSFAYKNWLENLKDSFEATSDSLTDLIEGTYPFPPKQSMDNCGWESIETTLYGNLVLKRLASQFKKRSLKSNQIILEKSNQDFKDWMKFTQWKAFRKYLSISDERSEENSPVILKVFQKIWGSSSQWMSQATGLLFERFNEMESDYRLSLSSDKQISFKNYKLFSLAIQDMEVYAKQPDGIKKFSLHIEGYLSKIGLKVKDAVNIALETVTDVDLNTRNKSAWFLIFLKNLVKKEDKLEEQMEEAIRSVIPSYDS